MQKKYNLDDTIASLATFPQRAAIGIIKISGRKALDIAARVFSPARPKNIRKAKTYTLHYGWIKSGGEIVDEVLISIMKAPHSYTRQDVVEIYTHSGPAVLNKVLNLVLRAGARLAEPGEFTQRAYLLGRIDLIQAEAINNISRAKNDWTLRQSLRQLEGALSQKLSSFIKKLEKMLATLQASISFPLEDIELERGDIEKTLSGIMGQIEELAKGSRTMRRWYEGFRCVLCGRVNVGKSSLFNAILDKERVIVSALAGTTRDTIEEEFNLGGYTLRLVDTAGLGRKNDFLEEKAQNKSQQIIKEADILLVVIDNSSSLTKEEKEFISSHQSNSVLVINKCDLKTRLSSPYMRQIRVPQVRVSAKTKEGISRLEKMIVKRLSASNLNKNEVYLGSLRQQQLMEEALSYLKQAKENLKFNLDKTYFLLQAAVEKLYNIQGVYKNADVLEQVFRDFCIGK